ncbi:MAG: hypothetical protein RLZZ271_87 [Pseudomonadota bacterium]
MKPLTTNCLRLCLAVLLFTVRAALAQPVLADPDSVKAAYLVNLLRYTTWPAGTQAPDATQVLCVLDMDALDGKIAGLDGKSVAGRSLVVRQVADAAAMRQCHMLFVGANQGRRLSEVLRATKGYPVLLVSDAHDAARAGAAVELLETDSRIRLIVHRTSVEPVGIAFSAQLLRVALTVF